MLSIDRMKVLASDKAEARTYLTIIWQAARDIPNKRFGGACYMDGFKAFEGDFPGERVGPGWHAWHAAYNYKRWKEVPDEAISDFMEVLRNYLPLYEISALLGLESSDEEEIVRAIKPSGRMTRSGWNKSSQSERITFKTGWDFRTALPYAFVRLDGMKVISLWPAAGGRRFEIF